MIQHRRRGLLAHDPLIKNDEGSARSSAAEPDRFKGGGFASGCTHIEDVDL